MVPTLQHNFDVIQYLLQNASPVQLMWRDEKTGWTLGEIIHHLAMVEKWHAGLHWTDPACNKPGWPAGTGDLAAFVRYRQATLARLQRLAPEAWQQPVATAERGLPLTPAELAARIEAHDRLHLDQIEWIIRTMPLNPLLARALVEIHTYHHCYQPYLAGITSLLDIGVGTGLALRHVMDQNPHITTFAGVDVRDLRLKALAVPMQLYDGHTLPFPAERFDVALLFYVLHHCQDPYRLLAEAIRVIKSRLIVIEEFSQEGDDRTSLDLTERHSHRALGIPTDLPYHLFDQAEFGDMIGSHRLRLRECQLLPSQTTRPVKKYLYVLEKDPE